MLHSAFFQQEVRIICVWANQAQKLFYHRLQFQIGVSQPAIAFRIKIHNTADQIHLLLRFYAIPPQKHPCFYFIAIAEYKSALFRFIIMNVWNLSRQQLEKLTVAIISPTFKEIILILTYHPNCQRIRRIQLKSAKHRNTCVKPL